MPALIRPAKERALGVTELRLMILERCDRRTLLNLVHTYSHVWSNSAALELWACPRTFDEQVEYVKDVDIKADTKKLCLLQHMKDRTRAKQYARRITRLHLTAQDITADMIRDLKFPRLNELCDAQAGYSIPHLLNDQVYAAAVRQRGVHEEESEMDVDTDQRLLVACEASDVFLSISRSSIRLHTLLLTSETLCYNFKEFSNVLHRSVESLSLFLTKWPVLAKQVDLERFRRVRLSWLALQLPANVDRDAEHAEFIAAALSNPYVQNLYTAGGLTDVLHLPPVSFARQLKYLRFRMDVRFLCPIIRDAGNLTRLSVTVFSDSFVNILPLISVYCPQLRALTVTGDISLALLPEPLCLFARNAKSLQELWIDVSGEGEPSWDLNTFQLMLEKLPKLTALSLQTLPQDYTRFMFEIGQKCREIRTALLGLGTRQLDLNALRNQKQPMFPSLERLGWDDQIAPTKKCSKRLIQHHFPLLNGVYCKCSKCASTGLIDFVL